MAPSPSPPTSQPPKPVSPEQFASNVDTELNRRSLSLRGDDRAKLGRLRRGIKKEKGKEVSETGEVKYKKEFKYFTKLPLELRRMVWKRAIPVFPRRVITVEKVRDVTVVGNQLIVTYPRHPALDLMVTCKELKEVLVEQCFPHLRTTAKGTFTTEEIEAPEVIEFRVQIYPWQASGSITTMTSSTFPKRISLAIGWTASEGQPAVILKNNSMPTLGSLSNLPRLSNRTKSTNITTVTLPAFATG